MLNNLRRVAATAAVAAAFVVPATRPALAAPCSSDTFPIGATPVTVRLCPGAAAPAAGGTIDVAVDESYAGGGKNFTRSSTLSFLGGTTSSRTTEDVSLAPLGIEKSLHLTIGYRAGALHIEHALLIPGAVPLR